MEKPRRIRVPTRDLKLGMFVAELDRPWVQSPFTVHGFRLRSEEHLRVMKQLCEFVYVEVRNLGGSASCDTRGPEQRVQYTDKTSLEQEMARARATHRHAKGVIKGLYQSMRLGNSFDATVVKRTVTECVDSVIGNPNALLWLSLLKHVDEYTAEHSLNVGLLSIILGRGVGLPRADLETVGLCGMLHDIGKARIPLEVLNKSGPLTDEEFELMKTHTTLGYQMLKSRSDISAVTAEAAYMHHERLNSRGYPRAVGADQISYFSRIVAVADTYDAITSERCYSKARSSLEGLQILMGARGTHFDPELVQTFVDCIGIYPAGSIAELSNGEVGIILPAAKNLQGKPKVLVVRDANKKPCSERMLDLADDPKGADGEPISIRNLLSDGIFGIKLRQLHEKAIR